MVQNNPDLAARREPRIEPDEQDALLVERAISFCSPRRDKELFRLRYVRRVPDRAICNMLRIHPAMLQYFLEKAKETLETNLIKKIGRASCRERV